MFGSWMLLTPKYCMGLPIEEMGRFFIRQYKSEIDSHLSEIVCVGVVRDGGAEDLIIERQRQTEGHWV